MKQESTLILELPEDLEHQLAAEANQLGLAVTEYVLRSLLNRPVVNRMPENGAELVDYWQRAGLVGARSDIENSQEYARQLRREVKTQKRP